ncbi:hypothetical protein Q1W73_02425 [Asticcacaulis sp. ZE23SCel15]|uniref:hypothetical protein n=1 Tax=Asticcacaulis sp. ZE23SCel15 TaxID=3059027 RepID=UPI00265DFE3D|nr:hypothetical protein [Asticcacaulis sp. ZE23SCel15]WKL57857.1 hypothetical protein Q1W73_02425 [Asticcacaulis sp. ZE23SCel15]
MALFRTDETKPVNIYAMIFLLAVLVLVGFSVGRTLVKMSANDCVSVTQDAVVTSGICR